jgi:hypothetical protein
MKIDWNTSKVTPKNARISISDSVTTVHVSDDQLPDNFTLCEVAKAYAASYDHNGMDDTYAICEIIDLDDEETHQFAFDGHGNFEWNSTRQA